MTSPVETTDEYAYDVRLAEDITGFSAPADPHGITEVLLTGATGYLGVFLLRELLDNGLTVHCLVRAADAGAGLERLRDNLRTYELLESTDLDRVVIVPGDLVEPRLGLSDEDHAVLTDRIGAVYHCAAKVNFLTPYKWLRGSTVDGTHQILRTARAAGAPLHHISTTGVFEADPDAAPKNELDRTGPPGVLPLGYTKSKWVAEQLVLEADRRGVPVTIHRPGQVWGDSRSGACQNNDFVWRFIKGSVQAGVYPRGFRLSMNLVPVDYVCAAIVAIARRPEAIGGIFHQISPEPTDSARILRLIRTAGWDLREVSVIKWMKAISADINNAMFPLLRTTMDMEKVEAASFADKDTREFLGDSPIACPPIDDVVFGTYVSFFVRNGNLPKPGTLGAETK